MRDGAPDGFSDIGSDRDALGLQPIQDTPCPVGDALTEKLGHARPSNQPKLGRKVLDQPRRCVRRNKHPHHQVPELSPGRHVDGNISRVKVGHTRD
jgi:hypothetical protein